MSDLSGAGPWVEQVVRKARKAIEIVRYGAVRAFAALVGAKPRHRAKDRVILDESVLPRLAVVAGLDRVLFVGCDWYTEHVSSLFAGKEYITLEVDPGRSRYGASRHIVAPLSDLSRYRSPRTLDLIICNGVIGWGLNEPTEIRRSLAACFEGLRPGGFLLLGWDDVPEKRPVDVEAEARAVGLRPACPPGFDAARIDTGTYASHVFAFWTRD